MYQSLPLWFYVHAIPADEGGGSSSWVFPINLGLVSAPDPTTPATRAGTGKRLSTRQRCVVKVAVPTCTQDHWMCSLGPHRDYMYISDVLPNSCVGSNTHAVAASRKLRKLAPVYFKRYDLGLNPSGEPTFLITYNLCSISC